MLERHLNPLYLGNKIAPNVLERAVQIGLQPRLVVHDFGHRLPCVLGLRRLVPRVQERHVGLLTLVPQPVHVLDYRLVLNLPSAAPYPKTTPINAMVTATTVPHPSVMPAILPGQLGSVRPCDPEAPWCGVLSGSNSRPHG